VLTRLRNYLRAPATLTIVVIICAVFIGQRLSGYTPSRVNHLREALGFSAERIARGQWWRIVTPNLTNGYIAFRIGHRYYDIDLGQPGLWHLVGNVFGFLVAGPHVERTLGWRRYVVLAIAAGAVAYGWLMLPLPNFWPYPDGTSGLVYGLYGAFAAIALTKPTKSKGAWVFVVGVAILALAGLVGAPSITVEIHLGGLIAGFLLCLAFLRARRPVLEVGAVAAMLVALLVLVGVRSVQLPKADKDVVRFVETPSTPTLITSAFGSIWTTSLEDGTVTRIDPRNGRIVKTFHVADAPGTLVATDRYVFVTANRTGVFAIDPSTNRVVLDIRLRDYSWGIAATPGALWVALPLRHAVVRVDEATHRIVTTIRVAPDPLMVIARGSNVWVTSAKSRTVSRIDARSNTVAATVRVGPRAPYNMELDHGSLWVVTGKGIARLDARSLKVQRSIRSKDWIFDVVRTPSGRLWTTHQYVYELSSVDPGAARLSRGIRLGLGKYFGIARDDSGHLWVADGSRHGVLEINPERWRRRHV
jgi:YVTN family beta-propeller protein